MPTSFVDPLTPWIDPMTSSDKALASGFWVSFHGVSAFLHGVAIFTALAATILPIPLLASMCSVARPVEVKPPERVEMAVVDIPKPKGPEPPPPQLALADGLGGEGVAIRKCLVDADCAADEKCVNRACVEAKKPKKKQPPTKPKKKKKRYEEGAVAMLTLIGAADFDGGNFATLSAIRPVDDNAVYGGLVGSEIGDAFGAGGLGLSGVGVGDSVVGGTIGSAGTGSVYGVGSGVAVRDDEPRKQVTVFFNGERNAVLERALAVCRIAGPMTGVLKRVNGKSEVTTTPSSSCVKRRVERTVRVVDADADDGTTIGFTITPRE